MENQNFKILIVDDISKNIQLLGNLLREESYKTGFATSGQQALDILQKNDFDLILLDIMMPVMDGYEVCQKIRTNEKTKNIPVIFLTAKIEDEAIIKGFELGAQDYVTKPFKPKELLARVATHLELNYKRKQLNQFNLHLEDKVKERTEQLQEALIKIEDANVKLSQLENAKSKFLGIISHELRTPLNGIIGFASLLQTAIDDADQLEYLDFMLHSANRLLRFSEIAMLIAQLSVDRYKLNFKKNTLKAIMDSALNELDSKVREKKVIVDSNIPNTTTVFCDYTLMKIAFKHVLDNAIRFSPESDTIKVSYTEKNNNFEISIADNGEGFTDEALESVFQFFTVENVLNHSEGFGLGLAATKLIMEAHGSRISIDNRSDKGAEVVLFLNK